MTVLIHTTYEMKKITIPDADKENFLIPQNS